ncbi:MAG TPA: 2-hydroxychromene-2-carboxylate isomerase [Steroidobacteraceae bacterium]|jgi:2-hydroxychromene-2-carboxylate isomerase|nr:2-hydroxychromene-2-carboxylate isomerase [Steroidobacteraceae bacterium]
MSGRAQDRGMEKKANWYFDPISPYVYLQLPDLDRLPAGWVVRPVPVLLGALLNHAGIKAPAEVPAKRLHTYRQCAWLAKSRNLPFRMPPRHPFNPLQPLRLLCAVGPTLEQARIASRFVFGEGRDPSTPEGLRDLASALGVRDPEAAIAETPVKDRLRANTDEAVKLGVWGVPTFVVGEEIFWGADSFPMLLNYLEDPAWFETPEMRRIEALPVGAARK